MQNCNVKIESPLKSLPITWNVACFRSNGQRIVYRPSMRFYHPHHHSKPRDSSDYYPQRKRPSRKRKSHGICNMAITMTMPQITTSTMLTIATKTSTTPLIIQMNKISIQKICKALNRIMWIHIIQNQMMIMKAGRFYFLFLLFFVFLATQKIHTHTHDVHDPEHQK